MKKGRIYLLSGIGAAVVLAAGATVWAFSDAGNVENQAVYKEVTVERGTLTVGVTESGSVSVGTLEQEITFSSSPLSTGASGAQSNGQTDADSSLSKSLEVEEVCVTVGQTVAEKEPLLKLSADSVQAYKAELEKAVSEAQTAVSEASLNAETKKLEAGYSYNLSVAQGSVAAETYQAALESLQEAVDDAQEAVNDSASLINYYQEQIAAGVDLSASLAEEQLNYNKLCTKLKSAQSSYTTKSIEAEEAYQKALLSSQNADREYSVNVSGADNEIDEAKDTLADAAEALEEFESCIGADGIIYAEYAGTITEIAYAAGDTLTLDSAVAVFADAAAVTMTVSVSQEDVSEIAVGDTVNIALTAYEDTLFKGVVESIDTSASSGSSTVSYNVTIAFTGDITGVYADMTGNVTFIQKQVEDVLYVSNKAVIAQGTSSCVKVKDSDGTVRTVQVETGFSDGVNVEIVSGLEEGETVLIESQVKAE